MQDKKGSEHLSYYINKISGIIHKNTCSYSKRTLENNSLYVSSVCDELSNGHRFCKCCCKNNIIENFTELMEENSIVYQLSDDGSTEIETPVSKWKIVYYGDKPVLYHKNDYYVQSTVSKIEGYHFQTNKLKNVHSIINYIICHDDYRKAHNINYDSMKIGRCRVNIDPYILRQIKTPFPKSERTKRLESYKKENPNPQKHGKNSKKGKKKHLKKKRNAIKLANNNNFERVSLLLDLIAVK